MKPRVLIVDGHSIISQWPDLTLQHAKRTAVARESLVRMLTGLQDNTDWHVTVVFDGNGVKPTEVSGPHGIQVFYSTADQTADSVIERLAAKYSDRYEVTVATNDFMERTTVASLRRHFDVSLAASGGNRNGGTQSRRAPQTIAPALSAR